MSRESRPMSSLRTGSFDEPPANTTPPISPRSARRRFNPSSAWPPHDISVPAQVHATPITSLPPTSVSSTRSAYEATYQRRRRSRMPDSPGSHDERDAPPAAKRRKVESSHDEAWPTPIKYGKYGQEVPGKLRMKIVSCDGGQQHDQRYPHTSLGCENILRHDRSVYSSNRNGCNIVLRHEDWTSFCLEKLHIVAPENGFRHPIRHGLVHVAMDLEDLQQCLDTPFPPPIYAQRHHISPSSPPPQQRDSSQRHPRQVSPADELSLYEALQDPVVNAAHERSSDSDDTTTETSSTNLDDLFLHVQSLMNSDIFHPEEEPWVASDLSEMSLSHQQRQQQQHSPSITLTHNTDLGPEDPTPPDVLSFRAHRERLARLHNHRHTPFWPSHRQQEHLRAQQEQQQVRDYLTQVIARNGPRVSGNYALDISELTAFLESHVGRMTQADLERLRERIHGPAATAAGEGRGFALWPPPPPPDDDMTAEVREAFFPGDDPEISRRNRYLVNLEQLSAHPLRHLVEAVRPAQAQAETPTPRSPLPSSMNINNNNDHSSSSSSSHPSSRIQPPPFILAAFPLASSPSSKVTSTSFAIPRDKHHITLNFSPEVSGKFILLQLWGNAKGSHGRGEEGGARAGGGAPSGGGVDVQSVMAVGFGGGRWFAAQEVR